MAGCEVEVDLEALFELAASYLATVASQQSSTDLMYLYARFKLVTVGKCNTPRPGIFEVTKKQKWDAWNAIGAKSNEEAMVEYVDRVTEMCPDFLEFTKMSTQSGDQNGAGSFGMRMSQPATLDDDRMTSTSTGSSDSLVLDMVKENRLSELKRLLPSKTDKLVSARDANGLTMLHWAVDGGDIKLCRWVCDNVAELVNVPENDGSTPLHYAASCDRLPVVQLLLKAGADKELKDGDGLAPWEVASSDSVTNVLKI